LNRGTLPIVARLQSLQAPSRLAPGGARVIADFHDPNPLAALLREVNETILARALMFESSGGASLTLEISGRRVLRLTSATGVSGAERCLAAPALEEEQKDDLIKLLQAVAAPRNELRVMSSPPEREIDGVSVGFPVALLADLCLIELNEIAGSDAREPEPAPVPAPEPEVLAEPEAEATPEPEPAPPENTVEVVQVSDGAAFLSRLAQDTGPALMAWLISGGVEDGRTEGPEEMVSHLQGFLEDELEALTRQLDLVSMVPAGPVCLVLGATLVSGHSILCARSGDGILLGVIEGDGTQTLLRAWNSASA
jgi:hypothetical protein